MNAEQHAAVTAPIDVPLVVSAGPGSGKTFVLIERILHILKHGSGESNILVLAFSRSARNEVVERVAKRLKAEHQNDDDAQHHLRRVHVHTFHSFSFKVIRDFYVSLGFQRPPSLCTKDGFKVLKEVMDSRPQLVQALGTNQSNKPYSVREVIKGFKNNIIKNLACGRHCEGPLMDLFEMYSTELRARNLIQFHDMVQLCNQLFRESPSVLNDVCRCYRFTLVDEVQDINGGQRDLLLQLCSRSRRISIVGDADQLIYGFQGANATHLEKLLKCFRTAAPGPQGTGTVTGGGSSSRAQGRIDANGNAVSPFLRPAAVDAKYPGSDPPSVAAPCTVVALRVNYRSIMPVIQCCNVIINAGRARSSSSAATDQTFDPGRQHKAMVCSPDHPFLHRHGSTTADAHRVRVVECIGHRNAEIDFIIAEIQTLLGPYFDQKKLSHRTRMKTDPGNVTVSEVIRPQDIAVLCRYNKCISDIRQAVKAHTAKLTSSSSGGGPMFAVKSHKTSDTTDASVGGAVSRGGLDSAAERIIRRLNGKTEAQMMLSCLKLYYHRGVRGGERSATDVDGLCMLTLPPVGEADQNSLMEGRAKANSYGAVILALLRRWESETQSHSDSTLPSGSKHVPGVPPLGTTSSSCQSLYDFLVEQSANFPKCTVLVGWCKTMSALFDGISNNEVKLSRILDSTQKSLNKYFTGLSQNTKHRQFKGQGGADDSDFESDSEDERESLDTAPSSTWNKQGHFQKASQLLEECISFEKNYKFGLSYAALEEQLKSFIVAIEAVMCSDPLLSSSDTGTVDLGPINSAQFQSSVGNISSSDKVWLGTVHKSKGLQWKAVFVYNALESTYRAHQPAYIEDPDVADFAEQDQTTIVMDDNNHKNLLYVAMSRAEVTLYLSHLGKFDYSTQSCALSTYLQPLLAPSSASDCKASVSSECLAEKWLWEGGVVRSKATRAVLPPALPLKTTVASSSGSPCKSSPNTLSRERKRQMAAQQQAEWKARWIKAQAESKPKPLSGMVDAPYTVGDGSAPNREGAGSAPNREGAGSAPNREGAGSGGDGVIGLKRPLPTPSAVPAHLLLRSFPAPTPAPAPVPALLPPPPPTSATCMEQAAAPVHFPANTKPPVQAQVRSATQPHVKHVGSEGGGGTYVSAMDAHRARPFRPVQALKPFAVPRSTAGNPVSNQPASSSRSYQVPGSRLVATNSSLSAVVATAADETAYRARYGNSALASRFTKASDMKK